MTATEAGLRETSATATATFALAVPLQAVVTFMMIGASTRDSLSHPSSRKLTIDAAALIYKEQRAMLTALSTLAPTCL